MPRSRSTSSLSYQQVCQFCRVSVFVCSHIRGENGNPMGTQWDVRTRICLLLSLAEIVPVCSSRRSLSVLLPWSMWATMQKFRYRSIGMAEMRASSSEGVGFGTALTANARRGGNREGRVSRATARRQLDHCRACGRHCRVQARPALQARLIET